MPPSFSKASATSSHATLRVAREILKPSGTERRPPVIVQIEPARIIHAQPQEFRRLVQLLTGKQSPTAADDSPSALPCSHLLIDINVAYEGDEEEEEESRYCD